MVAVKEHRIFAAWYDRMLAPMEREIFGRRRAQVLPGLSGDVLDVGAGTGVNLEYFQAASRVVAAEPDPAMRRKLEAKVGVATVPVEVSDASADDLPFPASSFDAVVFTLVLCTVPDLARALDEARRVLRPGGKLVVLEHVRGDGRLARWQDRIVPLWRRIAAGCHPNRDTRAAIERAGFTFESVDEFRVSPSWMPTSPMLVGVAGVA